jgi:hypothetical protein
MMETSAKANVISCDACGAICLVSSELASMLREGATCLEPIASRVYIHLRDGRVDARYRRSLDGVAGVHVPGVGRVIAIREYPFFCEDCFETAGAGKLSDEWKPLRYVSCATCGEPAQTYCDDDGQVDCKACRQKR